MDPMPGAVEAVTRLSAYYQLPVITKRSVVRSAETHALLDKHFGTKLGRVHFTNGFHKKRRSKGSVCVELGIRVFVEDSPEDAADVASEGVTVLLMDSPWNQEVRNTSRIVRVFGWRDAIDFIG
jgi:hypothetical protein